MQTVNPYVLFNGNCEEAFNFYAECFRTKIDMIMPHEGTPAQADVPAAWLKKIMHAQMSIGGVPLMGSDVPAESYEKPQGFSVSVQVDSTEEAERVFQTLAENGQVQMPIQETFWALRFGMLVDRFNIPWMISCPRPY